MTRTLLRQAWCSDITDHPAHTHMYAPYAGVVLDWYLCPGRYTPSRYRAPDPQPRPGWTDNDPFAGFDD